MRISFNEKSMQVTFHLEEQDEHNARLIEQLMLGKFTCLKCSTINENNGWKLLVGYMASAREAIIESGKQGVTSRVKRAMSDLKMAELLGFDAAVAVPTKVVAQAKLMRELEEKRRKTERTISNQTEEY